MIWKIRNSLHSLFRKPYRRKSHIYIVCCCCKWSSRDTSFYCRNIERKTTVGVRVVIWIGVSGYNYMYVCIYGWWMVVMHFLSGDLQTNDILLTVLHTPSPPPLAATPPPPSRKCCKVYWGDGIKWSFACSTIPSNTGVEILLWPDWLAG